MKNSSMDQRQRVAVELIVHRTFSEMPLAWRFALVDVALEAESLPGALERIEAARGP